MEIAFKGRGIFFAQRRFHRKRIERALRRLPREGKRLCEIIADLFHPGVLLLRQIRPAKRAGIRNPLLWEGVSLRVVIQAADGIAQLRIVPTLAHQLQKLRKSRIILLIKCFKHRVYCFTAQEGELSRVQNPVIRREVKQVKMLAHQVIAKAVDRADRCAGQQHLLAQQPRIVRPGEPLGDGGGNTLAHFSGSGLCEGHDQQSIRVAAIDRIEQPLDDTLHQHRRFAGARRRIHQQRPAARLDGVFLLRRPFSFCHALDHPFSSGACS